MHGGVDMTFCCILEMPTYGGVSRRYKQWREESSASLNSCISILTSKTSANPVRFRTGTPMTRLPWASVPGFSVRQDHHDTADGKRSCGFGRDVVQNVVMAVLG